jgi:hypothetical protein
MNPARWAKCFFTTALRRMTPTESRRHPVWVVDAHGRRQLQMPHTLVREPRQDAALEIRNLFVWLRRRWWGDPSRTQGFPEEQPEDRA